MKNTLCPSFLIMDIRDPKPNGGLFSPVKKGLFSGAAEVVNSMFKYPSAFYLKRDNIVELMGCFKAAEVWMHQSECCV